MVDANAAYGLADARHLAGFDAFDLMMIEQPLAREALEEMGVHFSAIEAKSALRAGEMHRRHRQRAGDSRRIDDFMVGAHALLQCDGLITWNDKFYRDYFKGLKLVVPQA